MKGGTGWNLIIFGVDRDPKDFYLIFLSLKIKHPYTQINLNFWSSFFWIISRFWGISQIWITDNFQEVTQFRNGTSFLQSVLIFRNIQLWTWKNAIIIIILFLKLNWTENVVNFYYKWTKLEIMCTLHIYRYGVKTNSTIIYKIKIFSVIQRYCCKSGFWRFTATSHQNIITFADQKFQTCSLYVLILKFLLTIFTDENCSKTYSKILIKIIMYNLIRSNMQFLPAFENQINHNHN